LLCERAGELRRMEAAVAAARAGVEAQQRDANRRDMAAAAAADQLHQRHTRVEHMEGACAIERERKRGRNRTLRPSRKQPAVMHRPAHLTERERGLVGSHARWNTALRKGN
jgi:hypothetical protein